MSYDQLEQYLENNADFEKLLENTINSVNDIPLEKDTGSLLVNLRSAFEASFDKNIVKITDSKLTTINVLKANFTITWNNLLIYPTERI